MLVLILACSLFFCLIIRTGYLQLIKGEWLSTKASEQQTREIPIEPKRGTIYDANMKELAVKEFGSIEEWKKHYIKTVSSEEMQKGYAKVVEWYGGKEQFLSVANNPISKEAAESYNQQFDNLLYKLAAKKVCSPDSSEVRELVSEYGFLMKQLSQIKKEHGLMVAQAQYYRNEKIKPMIDEKYGNGTAEFFAQAFEAFYKDK